MLIKTFGSAVYGIEAITITVEVNIGNGIKFFLVGLPDNAVKESHQRISAALKNNGYRIPGKEITINMAPADIKKEGSAYDITIAIGILAASAQIINPTEVSKYVIMGELALDGGLRPIKGALPIAVKAKKEGFLGIILPQQNAREAAFVDGLYVYGAENINQVITFFNGKNNLQRVKVDTKKEFSKRPITGTVDFVDVKGQENVKRALEIAAAGGHNAIMIGPLALGNLCWLKEFLPFCHRYQLRRLWKLPKFIRLLEL